MTWKQVVLGVAYFATVGTMGALGVLPGMVVATLLSAGGAFGVGWMLPSPTRTGSSNPPPAMKP